MQLWLSAALEAVRAPAWRSTLPRMDTRSEREVATKPYLISYARSSKGDDQSNTAQARALKTVGCKRLFEEAALTIAADVDRAQLPPTCRWQACRRTRPQ